MPHQYIDIEPGFSRFESFMRTRYRNYQYNTIGIGMGEKSDFTNQREARQVPAAIYKQHEINSIAYQSKKKNRKTLNGFYSPHSAYSKICYDGMEK